MSRECGSVVLPPPWRSAPGSPSLPCCPGEGDTAPQETGAWLTPSGYKQCVEHWQHLQIRSQLLQHPGF